MKTAFILHGCNSSPENNWFPWMKQQLEKKGYVVFVPQFPIYEKQTPDQWMKILQSFKTKITPETIVIGHSLGGTFLLHILEKYTVQSAYLVSGFASRLNNEFDEPTKAFIHAFDWKIIRKNVKNVFVIQGDNDPYVPAEKAQELATHLGVSITYIKNGGHCCDKKFPQLLEMIP